jgi:serine phosphatase RsbU (regulator of sigma subunit)
VLPATTNLLFPLKISTSGMFFPLRAISATRSKRIESWNFALGILDYSDADLQPITVKVSAGSQFVLYTDGVVEMSDQAGNLFGQEQLEATLCANKPENRLNAVKQIITTYLGDQPAQDDVSMLVITC